MAIWLTVFGDGDGEAGDERHIWVDGHRPPGGNPHNDNPALCGYPRGSRDRFRGDYLRPLADFTPWDSVEAFLRRPLTSPTHPACPACANELARLLGMLDAYEAGNRSR